MRITVFIIFALVATCAFGLKVKKMNSAQIQRYEQIKKENTWAGILLNLAELHMMSKGPVQDLVEAIESTVTDLQAKRVVRDAAYVKRTNEHNALVTQLNADIANAEADIEQLLNLLETLEEQRIQLNSENTQLAANNNGLRSQIKSATNERQLQHEEFLTKLAETNEAIAAVDECLAILNEFALGGASFAQVKKASSALENAQHKIQKTHIMEAAFLKALVQVAVNQEFADSNAVANVIAKFNEIRNNLIDSSMKLGSDENQNQNDFEKFVRDSKEEIYNNEQTIEYNNGLLEENAANTAANQEILANRRQELADFQQALADENTSFELATKRYEAWCAENDREVAVCNEALQVIGTLDIQDYIQDRIDQEDGLVSSGMRNVQQHGQGVEVFNFDYQD